ncbi:MAG TPA: DinB family protein [Chloroflexota bacterium]|nr:DinB family protein [Chloroflexota bacterium]
MGQRAEALAAQFEQANADVISAIDGLSDTQWRAMCAGENWPVGVTAHHIAGGHQPISGFVQMIANSQPLPALTSEMLDQGNAQHAQQYANCTKAETLELLRSQGQAAANLVRGLSDEQLDRSQPLSLVGGAVWTTQQFIENGLIGHPRGHLESIKKACGL